MKKLLLPLIILLLIIGYFMSRGGDREAKDAYDSLEQPDTEQQMEDKTTPPDDTTTPPDGAEPPPNGMGTDVPQQPDQPDTVPPGATDDPTLRDKTEEAAEDVGEAVGGATERAGEAVESAAEKTGEAIEEAGDAAKKAAEEAAEKLRGEDEPETGSEEEPQD